MKGKYNNIIVLIIIIVFCVYATISNEYFYNNINQIETYILSNMHFLFFLSVNISIIALIVLTCSKYGKIRIGGEDARPKYSRKTWYAMLFSAGMGVGIMFYSVVEPLEHYYYTPMFSSSNEIASSLATTYFSWGIHAWSIYALVSLAFSFYAYNMNLPLKFSTLFYPMIKDKIYGNVGTTIDIFGAIITLFALSSSLSLGSMQINSGMHYLFNTTISQNSQVVIIIVVIMIATISVLSGLDKGVKILSETNIKLALILMVIIFLLGPTVMIVKNIINALGLYVINIVPESLSINSIDLEWSKNWPIFYMSWWISWSIFVGIFIAKISKGRTIREFIISIVLIPTMLSVIWFGVLGITSISLDEGQILSNIASTDVSLALFQMLDLLVNNKVIKVLLQLLGLIIIILFFVTSSDSGSLIVDNLINGEHGGKSTKLFWSIAQGTLAITIIIVGGMNGITLIQNLLVIVSLPLTIVLLYVVFSLVYKIWKIDKKK